MIAKTSKPDALTANHRFIKTKVYANCWDDLISEFRPYIELEMAIEKHSDPMKAVLPYVKIMESKNQNTQMIVAVAYELKIRKEKAESKKRNGWTL